MSSSLEEVPSSTAAASVVAPAPPAAASSLLPGNGSTENLSEEGGVPAPPSSSGVKEPSKEIIARNVRGTVKWFNVKSGYGFINRSDTKEDVFVHQTAIVRNNPKKAVRSVGDGEEVEFDVVVGEKGNEASNVSGPEGNCVKGSPYAADKRSRGGYRKIGRGYYPRRLPGRPLKDGEEGGHLLGAEDAKGSPPSRSMKLRYNGGGGGRPPMRRRGIHPGPTVGRPENNQGAQQQQPGNAGAPPNQQIEDDLLLLSAPHQMARSLRAITEAHTAGPHTEVAGPIGAATTLAEAITAVAHAADSAVIEAAEAMAETLTAVGPTGEAGDEDDLVQVAVDFEEHPAAVSEDRASPVGNTKPMPKEAADPDLMSKHSTPNEEIP